MIDVGMFAGCMVPASEAPKIPGYGADQYGASVRELADIVRGMLGFDLQMLAGPELGIGSADASVDPDSRRVFIERDACPAEFDQPYPARDLEDMMRAWS